MEGDYGYVRLSGFNEKATDEMQAALKDLQTKNPKMKGLVLDMRNNPGGLLDQAIAVSDAFLDEGEIVSTRGRHAEDGQRWNATPGDLTEGKPILTDLVLADGFDRAEVLARIAGVPAEWAALGVVLRATASIESIATPATHTPRTDPAATASRGSGWSESSSSEQCTATRRRSTR